MKQGIPIERELLGYAARNMGASLRPNRTPQPVSRSRYWRIDDHSSLAHMVHFEAAIPRVLIGGPDENKLAPRIFKHLAVYHEALPFDEAERRWIAATYEQLWDGSRKETTDALRAQEGVVLSAGVQRQVSGRELTDQWWLWRRQAGPFENQGSLPIAEQTLRSLGRVLLPPGEVELADAIDAQLDQFGRGHPVAD